MAEAYWTHCMDCRGVICGVEMLKEYDDVVVLYAHKTCHEERRPMDPNALWKDLQRGVFFSQRRRVREKSTHYGTLYLKQDLSGGS